jgi:thiamine phosphate synthase YjbQ (UPF0047 family)
MTPPPTEISLTLAPSRRFEAIDVNTRVAADHGDVLARYRRTLYCSMHSTAGYLVQSLTARLQHRDDRLHQFFDAFRVVFPAGAAYRHDQMDLREELTEEQRATEPLNADSHLTFIGAGMRNCVTYRNDPPAPVYFIDLDGTYHGLRRQRTTTVLAYHDERLLERLMLDIPVSRHSIDSVNLADPRLGLIERVNELLAHAGVEKGRVDLTLASSERDAGLTVNEYETLLMQHDLPEVLRDPLRFAKIKGRNMLSDPLSIPSKTLNYALFDAVRVLNSLMEALHVDQSVLERVFAQVMAVPARRFLRSRKISFLATDPDGLGRARLIRGTYQSPILVQWRAADRRARQLQITITQLS